MIQKTFRYKNLSPLIKFPLAICFTRYAQDLGADALVTGSLATNDGIHPMLQITLMFALQLGYDSD